MDWAKPRLKLVGFELKSYNFPIKFYHSAAFWNRRLTYLISKETQMKSICLKNQFYIKNMLWLKNKAISLFKHISFFSKWLKPEIQFNSEKIAFSFSINGGWTSLERCSDKIQFLNAFKWSLLNWSQGDNLCFFLKLEK